MNINSTTSQSAQSYIYSNTVDALKTSSQTKASDLSISRDSFVASSTDPTLSLSNIKPSVVGSVSSSGTLSETSKLTPAPISTLSCIPSAQTSSLLPTPLGAVISHVSNIVHSGSDKQYFNTWTDSLSAPERHSITSYTADDDSGYMNINSALRGTAELLHKNENIVNNIDNALSKASLPREMRLYRGACQEMLGELKGKPREELIGKIITEKAFMSTSMSKHIAFKGFKDDLKLIMYAPDGLEGANISKLSEFNEKEFLFDKGQKMVITDARYRNHGKSLTLRVQLLKDE